MLANLTRTATEPLAPVVGADPRYINLDNAASTPALTHVLNAVNDCLQWYASVHRGAGHKSQVSTRAYEDARQTVATFVGANKDDHVVIFGKNTTEAINKLAWRLGLKKNDIVITSLLEHHSNELPWRLHATVRHIQLTADGGLDMAHLAWLLERYAGRVKLVAITGASNVTGFLPDIHTIARLAHDAGARILIDAAQLAAHRQLRMRPLSDPEHLDYIALSAHKMYAPFGTGALIARRDTFEHGTPEYSGGGTIELVTPSSIDWAVTPERDEAGSPNVVGAVAMADAIHQLSRIGMDRIAQHERALTRYALQKMAKLRHVTIYGNTALDRSGVITFNVRGLHHSAVAAKLNDTYDIATRNGCFCAHAYVFALLGINAKEQQAVRKQVVGGDKRNAPGMVRISFGLYNTKSDVDAFIAALQDMA